MNSSHSSSRIPSSTTNRQKNIEIKALEKRGYTFGKKIGKGSYGSVIEAQYKNQELGTVEDLACKYVNRDKMPSDFLEKFFPRELHFLTIITHPSIIRVHSILQSGPSVFIFMRKAEKGDLLDYIKDNGHISEMQSNLWFYQMVSAVRYLHSLNIAHRDLKCENVFITKHMNVKIGDFGFARYCVDDMNEYKRIMSNTYCGSAAYAAPEVVSGKPYDPLKSDIWSLGVILCIMLNGLMPFDDRNIAKLLKDQKQRLYQTNINIMVKLSTECKSVIQICLEPNPKLRYDSQQLNDVKWLKKQVEKHSKK